MDIVNTKFQHHPRRLWIWRSPNGRTKNQINYVLVKARWKTSIKDVKTYSSKDYGSDHTVLIAEISLKLQKSHATKSITNRLRNDARYIQPSRRAMKEITPKHRKMQTRMNYGIP